MAFGEAEGRRLEVGGLGVAGIHRPDRHDVHGDGAVEPVADPRDARFGTDIAQA